VQSNRQSYTPLFGPLLLLASGCGTPSTQSDPFQQESLYTIGGTINGLSGTVVLKNNGGDDLSLSENGPFTFATVMKEAAAYHVAVWGQPEGQTCTVANGSGVMASADVTNVAVTCTDNPPNLPPAIQIKLASFNIENFGTSKASKPAVMKVLVDIALRYDVLLLQELTNIPDNPDDTGPVIRQYLSEINAASGNAYALALSPRIGGTQGEQYVILYRTQNVSILEKALYADPNDAFVREPLLTRIKVGNDEDFYISNIHTSPDFAKDEIYAQTSVAQSIASVDQDIILLGDWNSDGAYFNESTDWGPLCQYPVRQRSLRI
jgi:endonuclease/exonuclease/phosphatase family metal-dependent hydrolase